MELLPEMEDLCDSELWFKAGEPVSSTVFDKNAVLEDHFCPEVPVIQRASPGVRPEDLAVLRIAAVNPYPAGAYIKVPKMQPNTIGARRLDVNGPMPLAVIRPEPAGEWQAFRHHTTLAHFYKPEAA